MAVKEEPVPLTTVISARSNPVTFSLKLKVTVYGWFVAAVAAVDNTTVGFVPSY